VHHSKIAPADDRFGSFQQVKDGLCANALDAVVVDLAAPPF